VRSEKNKSEPRTLWLSEDTLLDTRLESAVEQRVEHGVGCRDLVVGLDVLLESDAAVQVSAVIKARRVKCASKAADCAN
jgi:hypothetical protein